MPSSEQQPVDQRRAEHPSPRRLLIGVDARPLGAFPSGWRVTGAHRDPADDTAALVALARAADRAGADFVHLPDRSSTSPALEHLDPSAVLQNEPLTAAAYLAAATKQIGIVASVGAAFVEPFAAARAGASLDRMSGGRVGLELDFDAEPSSALNYGSSGRYRVGLRADESAEYTRVLSSLWQSWSEGSIVADAASGVLVDRGRVHRVAHHGARFSVVGPSTSYRPVQNGLPIVHSGLRDSDIEYAARWAEIHIVDGAPLVGPTVAPNAGPVGDDARQRLHTELGRIGRPTGDVALVATIVPVVGRTIDEAREQYDALVSLVPIREEASAEVRDELPPTWSLRTLLRAVGLPLASVGLDDAVTHSIAERLNERGRLLLREVAARSGRSVGGARPITYRHLVVVNGVEAPVVVGDGRGVADRLETMFRSELIDGVLIAPPYLPQPAELFFDEVVPVLRSRGLVGGPVSASAPGSGHRPGSHPRSLRDRLGTTPAREPDGLTGGVTDARRSAAGREPAPGAEGPAAGRTPSGQPGTGASVGATPVRAPGSPTRSGLSAFDGATRVLSGR